jgi:hypothetical protein
MKKIFVSSALTLSAFFLLASASAKAQDFFFNSAYDRPVENVSGVNVGTHVGSSPNSPFAEPFSPAAEAQTSAPAVAAETSAPAVAAQQQIAHVH